MFFALRINSPNRALNHCIDFPFANYANLHKPILKFSGIATQIGKAVRSTCIVQVEVDCRFDAFLGRGRQHRPGKDWCPAIDNFDRLSFYYSSAMPVFKTEDFHSLAETLSSDRPSFLDCQIRNSHFTSCCGSNPRTSQLLQDASLKFSKFRRACLPCFDSCSCHFRYN